MRRPRSHPHLAVDGVLVLDGKLVTVVRGQEPFLGRHALPGGHVELGETSERAMVREMREETGLEVAVAHVVGVYSDPKRDPRGHTVSIAFALRNIGGALQAGSDAARVELVDPLHPPPLAFDHGAILRDFLAGGQLFR